MPANYPLHLAFTKEQMEWLERESKRSDRTKSKIVQELVEAQRSGQSHHAVLKELDQKTDKMLELQRASFANSDTQTQIILAFVKEIFRESSANLYRLNEVIDGFTDPEKVRFEVNEYVRKQESAMRTKALQIQEAHLLK
jgi:hypothetical protein